MICQICLADTRIGDVSETALRALPFGDAERARLEKIGNPSARKQSLAALYALRTLLEKNGLPPRPIAREAGGKPYFVGDGAPRFNLSHSHTLAAAALSPCPIGIDVEFVCNRRPHKKIATRFFTDAERQEWSREPSQERFFALWTAKEARAKLTGNSLLQTERTDEIFCRTYRLTTPDGTAFVSLAAKEPIEGVGWILPSGDITVESYENKGEQHV